MLSEFDDDFMERPHRTTSLVDDSTLCAKKDIIIQKLDQLLKKLGGEVSFRCSGLHTFRMNQLFDFNRLSH